MAVIPLDVRRRNLDDKNAAASLGGCDADGAAVLGNDVAGDEKSEPGALTPLG